MIFLNPSFLWALTALLVPIIIHLFSFRRYKLLYFSNTQFIDHVKKDTRTKNKLKQYLLLLMRLLFIASVVLAFARPIIPVNSSENQELVDAVAVYIDNSFSMEAESDKGPLIDNAISYAYNLVEALPGDLDYYLITNDFFPQHQRAYNQNEIKQEFTKVHISSLSRNINEIFQKATALKGDNRQMDLYIISDFQTHMLQVTDSIDSDLHINFIPLQAEQQNNVFIDSCWFNVPVRLFGHSDELTVKIRNISTESYVDIPLSLYVNDTLKAISSVNIESGETKEVPLSFTNTSKGLNKAKLQLTDYPVTFDNDLFMVYQIAEDIKVLIINGQLDNKYLTTLFQLDENNILLTQVRSGQERIDEFFEYNLIILNGLTNISTGLSSAIASFVSRGNSVLIVPNQESDIFSYNQFLQLLEIGSFGKKNENEVSIGSIDYDNFIFNDVFVQKESKPGLPSLNSVFQLQLNTSSGAAQVLSDLAGNCLLAEKTFQSGKVYLTSFPLDDSNAAFMKHPLFVPVFYNIAMHSQPISPLYYNTDANNYVEISNNTSANMYPVYHIVDSSGVDVIPLFRDVQGVTRVYIPEGLTSKGFFTINSEEQAQTVFALNYSRLESLLFYPSIEELEQELVNNGIDNYSLFTGEANELTQLIQERKLGKSLWKIFIFIALFFIIGEILIARLIK